MFLHTHWAELKHSEKELAWFPALELVNVEELGLEILVLVLRGEGDLRDHLGRES